MDNQKDKPERQVPDAREFLSREGHILAQAEAKARVKHKRRMLLINAGGALALAALLGLIFWLVNRR